MSEMVLTIPLNSTLIAFATTLFYSIFAIEVGRGNFYDVHNLFSTLLNVISIVIMPFAAAAIARAGVIHRNFRYVCIGATIQFEIACITRFIILYWQIVDDPGTDFIPLVMSIIRNEFFGYFCSVIGAGTMERLVATLHTEWYERGTGTLHVFVLVQIGLILPSLVNGILGTMQLIPHLAFFSFFLVQLSFSMISLFSVYNYNLHLIAKAGAQYEGYSLSRSFQLRENVRMLKYWIDIVVPIAVTTSGVMMLFACYNYLPNEYDKIRFVCIALFDAGVAGEQVILFSLLIRKDPAIFKEFLQLEVVRKLREIFRKNDVSDDISLSVIRDHRDSKASETDVYFANLDKAWA